jgi:hypothetical protein
MKTSAVVVEEAGRDIVGTLGSTRSPAPTLPLSRERDPMVLNLRQGKISPEQAGLTLVNFTLRTDLFTLLGSVEKLRRYLPFGG